VAGAKSETFKTGDVVEVKSPASRRLALSSNSAQSVEALVHVSEMSDDGAIDPEAVSN